MERFLKRLLWLFCLSFFPMMSHAELMNPPDRAPLLVWDADRTTVLPKNFRTTLDPISLSEHATLSLTGLSKLHASGSGQFSLTSLQNAIKAMQGNIWIVDLRQESHGFIDGHPFTWYAYENRGNENKSGETIQADELRALKALKSKKSMTLHHILKKENGHIESTQPEVVRPQSILSEKELVEKLKLNYIRLYIQDKYPPNDQAVDEFLAFVKERSPTDWLHFHCRAGSGRTTTLLVMYDILRNAQTVSLEDIIERQALLGPKNLAIMPNGALAWRYLAAQDRLAFLKSFYAYAKDKQGWPQQTWSEWKKTNLNSKENLP